MTDSAVLETYKDSTLQSLVQLYDEYPWVAHNIVLVITKARAGALVGFQADPTELPTHPVQKVLDGLDVPQYQELVNFRVFDNPSNEYFSERGLRQITDISGWDKDRTMGCQYYIASSPDQFMEHPPELNSMLGKFLDYPEQDTGAHLDGPDYPNTTSEFRDWAIEQGYISAAEGKWVLLVKYTPSVTAEGAQRAVQRGKRYYDACQRFDKHCDTNRATEDLGLRAGLDTDAYLSLDE
jgi:hypothetical protein